MTAESLREKAVAELRQFIALSIYLWICFAAILFFKSTILRAAGIAFLPLGFAGIKAVVSAKFIMVANFLPIASRRAGERLFVSMLRKSLMLMLLILIPYVGFAAIAEALGVENLLGVMIQRAEAEVVRSHKK